MEIKNGAIIWFVFTSPSLVVNVWSMKFYLCWHFGRFLGQLSCFVWIASEVTTSWDLETSQVYVGSKAWVWIQVRVRVGLREFHLWINTNNSYFLSELERNRNVWIVKVSLRIRKVRKMKWCWHWMQAWQRAKFTSVVRLGFGSKFEFELDFENFIYG